MTYAFSFDAKFCSGCKACQAACKDKNHLPTGVLWRRVYEVSGGSWQNAGVGSPHPIWENTVFAYNLSVSCNHCEHPKCAGVCPADAYDVRDNGIVILDSTKCVGCGYCAWACPYGAPQYNPEAGNMTKCDFCIDQLEQGLPPACVAACPMRVLDYGDIEKLNGSPLWDLPPEEHPFPMPLYSHTQPHLSIQPHIAMQTPQEKFVANHEEIHSRIVSAWEEAPLILFTLLGQLAAGAFWAMSWLFENSASNQRLIPHLIIGISLTVGMLASFAHLGTKKNAWRVLSHLSHSWLSREILFAVLFGLGWLVTAIDEFFLHLNLFEFNAITAILGIGFVYSMSQVYRIPAAPGWNTWRTNASFMVSALLLGLSTMMIFSNQSMMVNGVVVILLLVQLSLLQRRTADQLHQHTRIALILVGCILAAINLPGIFIFLLVALNEVLGRWLFYRSRL